MGVQFFYDREGKVVKKNFRCTDDEAWDAGLAKAEAMRRAGYDVDMTRVLNDAVTVFVGETPEQSAERLGLVKGEKPVSISSAAAFRRWAAAEKR
jgi:hexokinase